MFFKKRTKSKKILLTHIILGLCSVLFYISWWLDEERFLNPILVLPFILSLFYVVVQGIFIWYIYINIRSEWKYTSRHRFTVDVFLPVYNEPFWLVEKTLKAAIDNTYPHATYILDDGHKSEYKKLAEKYGAIYITRDRNEDNKAGNINNALKYSTGEIIAIFDVDHAPERNFIERIISYFENPNIGVVQTTLDHFNENQSFVANACAKMNDDFFGPTMLGMSGLNCAVIFGSNSVFRRTAFDDIGGYKAGLAEDLNTSLHMHAAGWKSVYHPEILAKGMVPADLNSFFKQQLKWAKGVFTVFSETYPKLFRKLNFNQHICYLTRMTYYLAGPVIFAHIIGALIALYDSGFGSVFSDYLLHGIPYVIMFFLIHQYAGKKYYVKDVKDGTHIEGVLLMLGAWPVYTAAFITHILGIKIPFIATPKEISGKSDIKLITPHIFASALLFISIISNLTEYPDFSMFINIVFACGLILVNSGVFYAFREEDRKRNNRKLNNNLELVKSESNNSEYVYDTTITNS